MDCDQFEPLIEAMAEGQDDLPAAARTHVASCARCQARLEQARAIGRFLMTREPPAVPAGFTQSVIALVNHERWQAEKVIDLGFNLAIAAGVLFIITGIGGLAWSLGFLTIAIDLDALFQFAGRELGGALLSQVQTIAMAAVLLTMALALWWWAEADPLS